MRCEYTERVQEYEGDGDAGLGDSINVVAVNARHECMSCTRGSAYCV